MGLPFFWLLKLRISTILVLFYKLKSERNSQSILTAHKGRPHFGML